MLQSSNILKEWGLIIYKSFLQYFTIDTGSDVMNDTNREPLKIKIRGEDGFRVTTIRISEEVIRRLDLLAEETHHSRNELINTMLEYAINNLVIERLSNQEIQK